MGVGPAGSRRAGFTLAPPLSVHRDGAALHSGAALPLMAALLSLADTLDPARAGTRLRNDALHTLLTVGPIHGVATRYLGTAARPVRAILFDKSAAANWSLAWHQDRTIAVRARHDVPGFGPWTRKQGILHVAPPFDVIAAMVTLRVHLDDVPPTNAPLLIAPGSHRFGLVPEPRIAEAVARLAQVACLARAGDVWAYATPILHASDRATRPARRRVLQVDFSARDLPPPLQWLGVGDRTLASAGPAL